jgi:hypothetical protein
VQIGLCHRSLQQIGIEPLAASISVHGLKLCSDVRHVAVVTLESATSETDSMIIIMRKPFTG